MRELEAHLVQLPGIETRAPAERYRIPPVASAWHRQLSTETRQTQLLDIEARLAQIPGIETLLAPLPSNETCLVQRPGIEARAQQLPSTVNPPGAAPWHRSPP